jgi:hypothetical protein
MTRPIDIERELDQWFSDGPDVVADRVIDAALSDIDLTSQRSAGFGRPWRIPIMKNIQPLFAGTAIVVAVGVVALVMLGLGAGPGAGGSKANPSPTTFAPGPSASPGQSPGNATVDTSGWVTFTSPRYGYTISYPKDWTVFRRGTNPKVFGADDPGNTDDELQAPSPSKNSFVVSSQALPNGLTEEAWIAAYLKDNALNPSECFPPRSAWDPVVIDGRPAAVHGGSEKCDFTEAVAFVGGRVYTMRAVSNRNEWDGSVFDRQLFDAILATIRFDPTAADDSPGSGPTPGSSASPAPS